MQKEINKASTYLPKVKKLEKDLELIDGNDDAEIDNLPKHLKEAIQTTKEAIKKKCLNSVASKIKNLRQAFILSVLLLGVRVRPPILS